MLNQLITNSRAWRYLGYDMTYQAEKVKVAVLPIGYNEGLLQGISNISWKYKNVSLNRLLGLV